MLSSILNMKKCCLTTEDSNLYKNSVQKCIAKKLCDFTQTLLLYIEVNQMLYKMASLKPTKIIHDKPKQST